MTKADHRNTIEEAKRFKQLYEETILADIKHGVNLTPFEEEVFNTSTKLLNILNRLIESFND